MHSCLASCAHLLLLSSPSVTRRAFPLLHEKGKAIAEDWRSQEDWALLDGVCSFTVGEGKNTATFWDALVASDDVLHGRSPHECAERIKALSPKKGHGSQPKRLDVWRRLPDGRYMGVENGRTLHITVSEEGHLDYGTQPHYIESTMGRVYELGLPTSDFLAGLVDDEPPPETSEVVEARWGTVGALILAVLAGGLALASHGAIPDLAQILMVEPSAAEVQAEIVSAMNSAMIDVMAENAEVQAEIVNAMNAAQSMQMAENADVQSEIVNAMNAALSMR